jgi:SAM-dependent methyltransferase
MNYRELLLGCGRSREKRIVVPGTPSEWQGLVTLDSNPAVKPDIVTDISDGLAGLYETSDGGYAEIANDYFDELHAYEVLEHLSAQGDEIAFFRQFSEFWRVLKPRGYFCATVPSRYSGWLWGDPSHKRAILPESLTFLDQGEYIRQCDAAAPSSMSDFRNIYRADFRVLQVADNRQTFSFILQAVKPSRWEPK